MLKLKNYISKFIRIFGYEIRRHSSTSASVKEPFYHFRELLDEPQPVIFDIGAYVGDTIKQFKSSFPESYIHAFEPFDESFAILKNQYQKIEKLYLNNIALGIGVGVAIGAGLASTQMKKQNSSSEKTE